MIAPDLFDETAPPVRLFFSSPEMTGEHEVAAPAFRLHDLALEALLEEGWKEIIAYDPEGHFWFERETGKALSSIGLRRDEFAPIYLAMRDEQGQALSETVQHGGLAIPGRVKMSHLPALYGLTEQQWREEEAEEGCYLASYLLFAWDNGNDTWPARASGEVFIRALEDWEERLGWDGQVGARTRPSALSAPSPEEQAWS